MRWGEVDGDGRLSPIDNRGLDSLNGEWGAFRAGDSRRGEDIPGSIRLRRCLSLALVPLLGPLSENGDSSLLSVERADDRMLLSLSAASLSPRREPRFDGWLLIRALKLLCERGVGLSMGLLDRVDTATDDGTRSRLDPNAWSTGNRTGVPVLGIGIGRLDSSG